MTKTNEGGKYKTLINPLSDKTSLKLKFEIYFNIYDWANVLYFTGFTMHWGSLTFNAHYGAEQQFYELIVTFDWHNIHFPYSICRLDTIIKQQLLQSC